MAASAVLPNVSDMSTLAQSTVFLKMSFAVVGNTRKVQDNGNTTSEHFTVDTDADKRRISHTKKLLESLELEAIVKSDAMFRNRIVKLCLPYDTGMYLLPVGMVETVNPMLLEYMNVTRPRLVDTFLAAYWNLREDARISLGSLYKDKDYPSMDAIRAKFAFTFNYMSFGVPGQLASLSGQLFQQESERQANRWESVHETIILGLRQDAFDMVSHLCERLTATDDGKQKILRASAVTNLQEFLSTLPLRNVTNDTELTAVMDRVRSLVSGTSAETLRSSDRFREQMRLGLDRASTLLGGMVEERATRRFRD